MDKQEDGTAPPADVAAIVEKSPPTALAAPSGGGGLVLAPDPTEGGAKALKAYIAGQLSYRSRQTAMDALRRLSRLLQATDPAQIPWPSISFEHARTIRTALYEMTRSGAVTPGTANLTLSHLRGLIRTMYGMGLVTPAQHELTHSDALKNIPGVRKSRGRALLPQEEKALREAAVGLGGYRGAMLDTAIVVAIGGGLRREEIANLTVEGFDKGRLIGKGNKERRLQKDADMQKAVDVWLEERTRLAPKHGGLFCSPSRPDCALSPWSFWSLVRTASHRAFGDRNPCVEGCRCFEVVTGPHDFRRTLVTRVLEQGLDIRQAQLLAGHASPETTARYDKRDMDELFEKRRNMKVIT